MDTPNCTMKFEKGHLVLLDQRQIPHDVSYIECETYTDVAKAIQNMTVRGAPAIGATAAYGYAMAASEMSEMVDSTRELVDSLKTAYDTLFKTRPTAVNLVWALNRQQALAESLLVDGSVLVGDVVARLTDEANRIAAEDVAINKMMAEHGAELVPQDARVLHHCNTGALATVDWGTALGVIRTAHQQGKVSQVWVDETRPRLQGARLTAWELQQYNIPMKLIPDGAAGLLMRRGMVDCVFVGADRVAANGDTCNKIGTYHVALAAHANGVPFYVCCPTSTIDASIPNGDQIPIEERAASEVTHVENKQVAPTGCEVFNPAFDVTPFHLITAIVTEHGVVRPPFTRGIASVLAKNA